MTLRQDIIERAEFCDEMGYGQPALRKAAEWGERDGELFLAQDNNTVDGQALMERMKNGAYTNGFHTAMRRNGAGY